MLTLKKNEHFIEDTLSLCPKCLEPIPAVVFERDGKVYIRKECKVHGVFEDVYWSDYELYKKARKFHRDWRGISNPIPVFKSCPYNCGLCERHKSHTALGNIVVTNRCNLRCFYCFFYADAQGYVYEPTLKSIKEMLIRLKSVKPVPANAIQFTGGEPTLREDLLEIIKLAKELKYDHVQLNTNGIKLAQDQELVIKLAKAGVNTVYLSFDGLTPKTNIKNYWEMPLILDNCRKAKLGVVLVPTVINGFNDKEVGDILKFGLKNIDIVRGVNYQPVSLVGMMSSEEVSKYRITIPDVISRLSDTGIVEKEDFYPIPTVYPISRFVENLTGFPQYYLTSHFACGMATYIFKGKDGKYIPLPRFFDVEGFLEFLDELSDELENGGNKYVVMTKLFFKLKQFVDRNKLPKGINFVKILYNVFIKHDYEALGKLHENSLFVGLMHFMDPYNYDINRVQRCTIHYVQPDGKIVPFCSFNVLPKVYRDKVQKEYSIPIKEWEKRTGRKLKDDIYVRDVNKLKSKIDYKKFYDVSSV